MRYNHHMTIVMSDRIDNSRLVFGKLLSDAELVDSFTIVISDSHIFIVQALKMNLKLNLHAIPWCTLCVVQKTQCELDSKIVHVNAA